jgi:hypothetical protein
MTSSMAKTASTSQRWLQAGNWPAQAKGRSHELNSECILSIGQAIHASNAQGVPGDGGIADPAWNE